MGLSDYWAAFGEKVTSVLPRSPFLEYIQKMEELPYLGWLNWFIPFKQIAIIFGAWLSCVAIFYLAQIVLRWLKVIQG